MTKQQAQRSFRAGRLHPHCPGCYQQNKMVQRKVIQINTMVVKAYECKGCRTRFIAYIQ